MHDSQKYAERNKKQKKVFINIDRMSGQNIIIGFGPNSTKDMQGFLFIADIIITHICIIITT
jgi:hypothetical protein